MIEVHNQLQLLYFIHKNMEKIIFHFKKQPKMSLRGGRGLESVLENWHLYRLVEQYYLIRKVPIPYW